MHLAHPRTSRDDRQIQSGKYRRGTAESTRPPAIRIPYRIGISAGPRPGALTASGQHRTTGPFPRPAEAVMRSPLKVLLITASLVADKPRRGHVRDRRHGGTARTDHIELRLQQQQPARLAPATRASLSRPG